MLAQSVHITHSRGMDNPPPRLIAHVFAEISPSPEAIAKLHAQLASVCAREGSRLVALIFDRERADRQPGDYSSLVSVASGEADGLVIARLPLSIEARPTSDLLCSALTAPLCMFNKAELEIRGLLPKVPPHRHTAPLASALRRAKTLRREGRTHTEIAAVLNAEGIRTLRGKEWQASGVGKLLARVRRKARGPSPHGAFGITITHKDHVAT